VIEYNAFYALKLISKITWTHGDLSMEMIFVIISYVIESPFIFVWQRLLTFFAYGIY